MRQPSEERAQIALLAAKVRGTMLPVDAALLRRLRLEMKTLELARQEVGPFTVEGFRLAGKIERLASHIEGVESRESEEFWAEHQPLLRAAEQIEAHYPEALLPLEVHDPNGRCPKCGGKPKVAWIENRLHETCKRCGFAWVTLPLDSSPEEEQTPGDG